MKEMKILHICMGNSLDFQGGITNYVRSLSLEQSKHGYDVYVLADDGTENEYKVIKLKSKIKKWDINKYKDKYQYDFINNLLKEYKFDIIHLHMILTLDFRTLELLKNYNYIVSLHDYSFICPRVQMVRPGEIRCEKKSEKCYMCFSLLEKSLFLTKVFKHLFPKYNICGFPIKSKKLIIKYLNDSKIMLENAKMLLPVSNRVMEIYKNSDIKNNYKVLHIGNDTSTYFDDNNDKKTVKKEEINFVILSAFNEKKGSELICRIIKSINNKNIKFHFWGYATKKQINKMKIFGIEYHGSYLQNDLKQILSKMDFGVACPIWEDNAPQIVMEMLNNRIPVFATKMGGIPDFINEKNGFIFDPFNENDINSAIEFLNNLNLKKINILRNNITKTITPLEHYYDVINVYKEILKIKK